MSNTNSWIKRSETHRYSQDDRTKQWKYEQELGTTINPFIDDYKRTVLCVGKFNLKKEPWRLAAIIAFRKFNLKVIEKTTETADGEEETEITLVKGKLH